jgi:hypothetical protein
MPQGKTGSNAIKYEQKVCIHVRMVGQGPGRESSELTEPKSRPPRGNPKLEEQSVGGGVAFSPGIPNAQQIRFPGEFTKPPVNTNKGRRNKPWLQPQGSIIPTNQHRNSGGNCHIPRAIGNQKYWPTTTTMINIRETL